MRYRLKEKHGVLYYYFTIRPETFALGLYSVIWSIATANCLWVYVLFMFNSLETSPVSEIIYQMICVHLAFAMATTFLRMLLAKVGGRSVVAHLLFYIWFMAKLATAVTELLNFPRLYDKIMEDTTVEQVDQILYPSLIGTAAIAVVEIWGLLNAERYFRARNLPAPNSIHATTSKCPTSLV